MTSLLHRFSNLFLATVLIMLPGLALAAPAVPSWSALFSPDPITTGGETTLTFTITNSTGTPAQNLAFSGTLPAGVTIASGSQSNTCNNSSLTATAGTTSISLSGGRLGDGLSCTVSLPITSSSSATYTFTSGDLTSDLGNSGTATATLSVNAAAANFSKSLSQSTVARGNTTVLTYDMTVTVAAGSPAVFYANTPSFSETLPAGLTFSSPLQATTDCGGSVDIDAGAGTFDFSGPTFETSGTCRVTVGLQAISSGSYILSNSVSFNTIVPGATTETAAVTLTVPAAPTAGLDLLKRFDVSQAASGDSVTLRFDLTNLDGVDSATDITLVDDLDAMLTGLVASNTPISNPCGSGSSLNGTSTLTLSGATLDARSKCSFDVTLAVPGGAAPGTYTNTTNAVTATYDGNPYTGPTASTTLTIKDPDLSAPSLVKSYTTDPVAPGGTVTLEYTLTNSSSTEAASNIGFSESLDAPADLRLISGSGTVCGGTLTQTSASPLTLSFAGGTLATGASCTIPVMLQVAADTTPGSYSSTTSLVTAIMAGTGVGGAGASDTLQVEGGANLSFIKEFSDELIGAGDTTTLTFTLTSAAESPNTATGLAFSDDIAAFLTGATLGINSNSCGGSAGLYAGNSRLDYTGGTLAPGDSCTVVTTVTIPTAAASSTYTNTTSTLTGTAGGEALTVSAASDTLQVLEAQPLVTSKSFAPSTALPGETVTLTYTLSNPDPSLDYTGGFFTDNYSTVLSGLAATSMPANDFCGTGSTASGTTSGSFSGLIIPAGGSCSFDVPLLVPAGAANGSYGSATSNVGATVNSTAVSLPVITAALLVDRAQISLSKVYGTNPVAPGETVSVDYTLTNLSSSKALTAITFSDDLDRQLTGLAASSGAQSDICGTGSSLSGAGTLTFTGGSLAAGASCSFSATLQVPGSSSANIYSGTTSTVSADASGLTITGPVASSELTVSAFDLPSFAKSFTDPVLGAGGSTTLTYVITNNDSSATLAGLRFTDDLDAALSGLVVTAGTGSNLCGSGSVVAGSGEVTLTGGTLDPGQSCSIPLTVTLPASASAASYPGSTSTLTENGEFAASATSATLTVAPAPVFSKAFATSPIPQGGISTLVFTINNSAATIAATSLDVTDTLPAGMVVAPTPNAAITCTGGTGTAVAGSSVVSYTGGTVAAGASCTISVDMRATTVGSLGNVSGDLTSSLGNSGTASDTLSVTAAPIPGFTKSFADSSVTLGSGTTLTLSIDNSTALIEATALDFTDTLPAGLTLASPPNASTTCTGGTLTATAGAGSISYSGGTVAASGSCSLSVDVITAGSGSLVNTSGDLTSSLGNSGSASATLKVPTLSFDSPLAGDDIVNSAEAAAVTLSGSTTLIEDGQSVSLVVTDSASATATGSATVSGNAWNADLDLSALADGALTVTADVADAVGTSTPQATASLSLDTATPSLAFDSPLATDDIVSAAEAAAVTLSGSSSGIEDAQSVSLVVTDNASATVTGNATVAGDAWSVDLDLSALADGSLTVTADAMNSAGNLVDQASTRLSLDQNAPAGYSASFDQDPVNSSNEAAISFTFASAETGVAYAYTIASDGGGSDVTGSGTIATASDQISGIDVSGLEDGTLTLSVVLTDSAAQAGAAATDTVGKDTDQPTVTISGPDTAQSDPFTVDLVFSETVTGLVDTAFSIDNGTASDLTGSGTNYSVTVTPDHDGPVTISLPADSAQNSTANGNLVSNEIKVIADLTGTPNPTPPADADGDGVPDNLESSTADRDGDGIVDSADYDPQGYFYCEDDGRILSGGGITVTGPAGSNSSVGISNNINIVRDGSTGEYQWFALVPGTYSVAYSYPAGGIASTARLSSGSLDVTSLLPANPAVIGSTEVGSTGVLADASLAANPAFYDSFVIEAGDPNVLANNIPMTQCAQIAVTVSASDTGAEANGATTDSASFTVSQAQATAQDTVISYTLGGTATSGTDFTSPTGSPTGSVTIVAGDTSAVVDLPVLEDGLIEGSETVTLTLTAVTASTPGVILSTTTADLTDSTSIADDDFAMVAVSNDDLTASENGVDTAAMSFTLLGQPGQDVQLAFSGDAQCSVSPATLSFSSANYATAQTLTITAIDDELIEGTHSCQPTVAVTSADAAFDGFALALAAVTVSDDLVDQIREPLTEILKNDLEETVKTQQRYFSDMSKGALSRLRAGAEGLGCGTLAGFDVDGTVNITGGEGQTDGSFGYDVYNCHSGSREILDGTFSLTRTENIGTQALLQVSRQRERFLSETDLRGNFLGGYLSRTNVTGLADGAINGMGVNGGIYGARQLSEGLFLDYYAAGAFGHHRYDLDFAATPSVIRAEGSYDYAAAFVGAALSGQHQMDRLLVTPRVGVDLAYALASDADVTATQLAQTDTGRIDIPDYNGGRLFAEIEFSGFGSNTDPTNPNAISTRMALAPRLACESSSYDTSSSNGCGLGLAFSREVFNPLTGLSYSFEIDYEMIDETDRVSIDFHRERRFADDRGAVVTRLSMPTSDSLKIEHGVRLDF